MNGILADCARREAWTNRLFRIVGKLDTRADDLKDFNAADRRWIENNTQWAVEAAQCVETKMLDRGEVSV